MPHSNTIRRGQIGKHWRLPLSGDHQQTGSSLFQPAVLQAELPCSAGLSSTRGLAAAPLHEPARLIVLDVQAVSCCPWGFLPGLLLHQGQQTPDSVAPACLPLLQASTLSALNTPISAGRLLSAGRQSILLQSPVLAWPPAGPPRAHALADTLPAHPLCRALSVLISVKLRSSLSLTNKVQRL